MVENRIWKDRKEWVKVEIKSKSKVESLKTERWGGKEGW